MRIDKGPIAFLFLSISLCIHANELEPIHDSVNNSKLPTNPTSNIEHAIDNFGFDAELSYDNNDPRLSAIAKTRARQSSKAPTKNWDLPWHSLTPLNQHKNTETFNLDSKLTITKGADNSAVALNRVNSLNSAKEPLTVGWTLNHNWLTVKANYAETDSAMPETEAELLSDTLRSAGYSDQAVTVQDNDYSGWQAGIGVTVEYDDYLFVSEFIHSEPETSLLQANDSYHVTLGKRFNEVLVHLSYGADDAVRSDTAEMSGIVNQDVLDIIAPVYDSFGEDQNFYSLGVSWEMAEEVEFKFEFTEFEESKSVQKQDGQFLKFAFTSAF